MLLTLWLGAVPLLVGLLFELLVVVPLRVPVNESPVFLLYQDWALGLLFLKIWTRLVMIGQGPLANDAWRAKFEQVGFSDIFPVSAIVRVSIAVRRLWLFFRGGRSAGSCEKSEAWHVFAQ